MPLRLPAIAKVKAIFWFQGESDVSMGNPNQYVIVAERWAAEYIAIRAAATPKPGAARCAPQTRTALPTRWACDRPIRLNCAHFCLLRSR
ncbi:hypothetical protein Q31b_06110 [Novipirellula aureliae]|uniref:Uncharacterized protein n=1 Tax=Novipirellula aureliae TaxID=2527966 RepID=A0A5C6EDZ0_9BACT|nr:sialate O-acetylesterase [Novipirellula aureliae]TWU45439.1 hypothetical protein Q31b_06110 [Novipirellula aureliae]